MITVYTQKAICPHCELEVGVVENLQVLFLHNIYPPDDDEGVCPGSFSDVQ